MASYYNDNEPYVCEWLRNLIKAGLIPDGVVDGRSIRDVQPSDVAEFIHVHFFAGLGGWAHALRLAGWPDDRPVWTGSCPCQPFSVAGKQKGFADERHLWPEWRRLIAERRPTVVFGEQVASAAAWLASVRSDLEAMAYAVGALPIEAASAGAFTSRPRFYLVANAESERGCRRLQVAERVSEKLRRSSEDVRALARPIGTSSSSTLRISDVLSPSYGIPARVAKLRALGNAIVPQVAAAFITAYMDSP